MKDIHIDLLNEKLNFLIKKGFKPVVEGDCYSLYKDELDISFFFACSSNEIACTISHKRNRLSLLELVEYFNIRPSDYYCMYGSFNEIPDVIGQYTELLETLVAEYQVFDADVFDNAVFYYQVMYNVLDNTASIKEQISLANRRFKNEDYFWAGKLYLEYYSFLKKSEKIKLGICRKKCSFLS